MEVVSFCLELLGRLCFQDTVKTILKKLGKVSILVS